MMIRHRVIPIVSAVSAAALLLAGCGAGGRDGSDPAASSDTEQSADTTGVTDTSVKVGAHFPLTGVAAPGYSEIPTGAKAYFDYVNAAGGIHGRKIDYVVKDDAYNPTNTSTVTNELVLNEEIFAMVGGLGTPTHSAVVDFLNEEKVPDLMVSSGSVLWGDDTGKRPWTFGWQPDYEVEAKVIGQWIAKNKPNAKVGLFLQDDDLGANGEMGLRRYVDKQIVKAVKYTPGNTDVAPQIAALQASGADLIVGFNVPSYTALSQLTAKKLNFSPEWVYTNVGSDPTLVGSLLAKFSKGAVASGANSLDGIYTTEYMPGVDTPEDPWVSLWQKVWDAHGKDGELTNYRIYGMSQAYAFVTALQAAGKDLNRQGIVDAIEKDGQKWAGPPVAPFRYSADSHLGISGVEFVQLKGGRGEPLTKVLTSDIGDAPITEDDSAANDAPPASGIPEVG